MAVEEIGVKLVTEGEKAVQKAFDSCEQALKSLEKATDNYVGAAKDQEQATSNVEKAIRGARSTIGNFDKDIMIAGRNMGSFADAASAMGMSLPATPMAALGMSIKAVGEFMINAVKDTLAYATQVRDLGRITGATAEDTSRLIQVSDDLKVEYSTLQQAAKALAQDGIALTTEALADASDEYLAITDAGERAEYAVKKFGRAGLELTKVLEMGGDALRAMAAEQEGGLILTQEQVDAARELEKAQDSLKDAISAITITLGMKFIPSLVDAVKVLELFINGAERSKKAFGEQKTAIAVASDSVEEYTKRVREVYTAMHLLNQEGKPTGIIAGVKIEVLDKQAEAFYKTAKAAEAFRRIFQKNTDELDDFSDTAQWSSEVIMKYDSAIKNATSSQRQLPDAIQATTTRVEEMVQAQLDAARAAEEVKTAQQKLTTFMAGAMGKENANYTKALQAEEKSLGDIQRRMRELLTIKSWSKAEAEEYSGLLTKQDEVKAKIEEVKTAHALAAKKIIFDMLAMQLAVGGLSKAESDFLIKTAKEWGLIDQATVDAWNEAEVYAAKIQDPAAKAVESLSGTIDTAIGKTSDLDSKLRNLPDREVNINITETTRKYTKMEFGPEPGPAAPYKPTPEKPGKPIKDKLAMGGSVQAGQPYLVGERGPELIVPDLSGMVMPNHMVSSLLNMMRAPSAVYNTTTINYNLGVTTMNSPQAVQRSFAMMQLLAG